jgi:hypothetical protein
VHVSARPEKVQLPSPSQLTTGFGFANRSRRLDLNLRRKPRPTKNPSAGTTEGLCFPVFCATRWLYRSGIARGSIGTGFTGVIRPRPLRVSPSRMVKPVRASIRARVGNNLGTVLATSAPCGQNAKTPRWRRASLGFADFKHHRNVFPMPRIWQKYRTQNPVLARGFGCKSRLRYLIGKKLETWSLAGSLSGPPTSSTRSAQFSPVANTAAHTSDGSLHSRLLGHGTHGGCTAVLARCDEVAYGLGGHVPRGHVGPFERDIHVPARCQK